jgi:hypothetical protein
MRYINIKLHKQYKNTQKDLDTKGISFDIGYLSVDKIDRKKNKYTLDYHGNDGVVDEAALMTVSEFLNNINQVFNIEYVLKIKSKRGLLESLGVDLMINGLLPEKSEDLFEGEGL